MAEAIGTNNERIILEAYQGVEFLWHFEFNLFIYTKSTPEVVRAQYCGKHLAARTQLKINIYSGADIF